MSALLDETTFARPAAGPAASGLSPARATAWAGDVLVTFGLSAAPPARRPAAPFAAAGSGDGWRVWE